MFGTGYFFSEVILPILFFGIPAASLVWFIVSLIAFLATPKDSEKKKHRKLLLIISAIIAGIFALIIAGFWILLLIAVANM